MLSLMLKTWKFINSRKIMGNMHKFHRLNQGIFIIDIMYSYYSIKLSKNLIQEQRLYIESDKKEIYLNTISWNMHIP